MSVRACLSLAGAQPVAASPIRALSPPTRAGGARVRRGAESRTQARQADTMSRKVV